MYVPKTSPIVHTGNKGNIRLHKDHAMKIYGEVRVKLLEFSNMFSGWRGVVKCTM
jgi:hypothetical protein